MAKYFGFLEQKTCPYCGQAMPQAQQQQLPANPVTATAELRDFSYDWHLRKKAELAELFAQVGIPSMVPPRAMPEDDKYDDKFLTRAEAERRLAQARVRVLEGIPIRSKDDFIQPIISLKN